MIEVKKTIWPDKTEQSLHLYRLSCVTVVIKRVLCVGELILLHKPCDTSFKFSSGHKYNKQQVHYLVIILVPTNL